MIIGLIIKKFIILLLRIKNRIRIRKLIYVLAVSFTFLFFSENVKAQRFYEDVVYLKNGSIIYGIIIEQVPNKSIKVQTKDGSVFVYRIDEIEKFSKVEKVQSSNEDTNNKKRKIKRFGYTNISEINYGSGIEDYVDDYSYGFQTINGYLFNPNFSLGLGLGIDKYKSGATFAPLFADLRVNILASEVSPFLACGVGYSLGFDENKGGPMLNASLGVKFFVSQATALNFSIGYRMQDNEVNKYYKETGRFLVFRFGASF